LTDNHPFRSAEFVQDCVYLGQKKRFSGVGAHHQNRDERASQTIFNRSRAILLCWRIESFSIMLQFFPHNDGYTSKRTSTYGSHEEVILVTMTSLVDSLSGPQFD
jgi:hypothetical protein